MRCLSPAAPSLFLLAGKKAHEPFELQTLKGAGTKLTVEQEARLAAYLALQSAAG